jgi:hypothetical protein
MPIAWKKGKRDGGHTHGQARLSEVSRPWLINSVRPRSGLNGPQSDLAGCVASACLLTRWWPMAAAPASTSAGTAGTYGHVPNAGIRVRRAPSVRPWRKSGRHGASWQRRQTSSGQYRYRTPQPKPIVTGIRRLREIRLPASDGLGPGIHGHVGRTSWLRCRLPAFPVFCCQPAGHGVCAGNGRRAALASPDEWLTIDEWARVRPPGS